MEKIPGDLSALVITIILAIVHIILCLIYLISDSNERKDIFVIPTFALAMTVFAISTLMLELRPMSSLKLPLLAIIGVSVSLISMGFVYMMRDAWGETWKQTYAYVVLAMPLIVGIVSVIIPVSMSLLKKKKSRISR